MYSDRYKSIKDVPDGATFIVPNDGANQGQALWLLQREGLIDAGKVPRSKGILFPQAPRTFASQLVIGTKYLDDPQIVKLKQAFADPRVAQYLLATDDPLVHGVLTPVSAN